MARPSEYRQSYMAFKAEGCEDFVPLREVKDENRETTPDYYREQ